MTPSPSQARRSGRGAAAAAAAAPRPRAATGLEVTVFFLENRRRDVTVALPGAAIRGAASALLRVRSGKTEATPPRGPKLAPIPPRLQKSHRSHFSPLFEYLPPAAR